MVGVDRHFSTEDTAEILGRSKQWMYFCVRHAKFTTSPVWHVSPARTEARDWHPCTANPHDKLTLPDGGRFVCVEEPELTLAVLGEHEQSLEWRNERDTLRWKYFAVDIRPIMVGRRRRYSVPIIRNIATACYRQGFFDEDELRAVLARLIMIEKGQM
jgi:hypothetical protein